jgi:hypothetical protein
MKIRLLEFYRDNIFLWDPHHKMYRDNYFTAKAWDRCATQFNLPGLTGQNCKKLVFSLRCYYKKLRVNKNNKTVKEPAWFKLMDTFLGPVIFDENNKRVSLPVNSFMLHTNRVFSPSIANTEGINLQTCYNCKHKSS